MHNYIDAEMFQKIILCLYKDEYINISTVYLIYTLLRY